MKRLIFIAGAGVVLVIAAIVAIVVIEKLRSDDPKLLTSAPAIPTSSAGADVSPTRAAPTAASTPASATTTAAPAATSAPTSAAAGGAVHFVIDPAGSSAKY